MVNVASAEYDDEDEKKDGDENKDGEDEKNGGEEPFEDEEPGYGPVVPEEDRKHPDNYYLPNGRLKFSDVWDNDNAPPEEKDGPPYLGNEEAAGSPETNKYYDKHTLYPRDVVLKARLYHTHDPSLPDFESLDGIVLRSEAMKAFRDVFGNPINCASIPGYLGRALGLFAYEMGIPGYEWCLPTRVRKDLIDQAAKMAERGMELDFQTRVNIAVRNRLDEEREKWEAERGETLESPTAAPNDLKVTHIAETDLEARAIKALATIKRKLPPGAFAHGKTRHQMSYRDFYKLGNFADSITATPLAHVLARDGWDFVELEYEEPIGKLQAAASNAAPKTVQVMNTVAMTLFAPKNGEVPASWTFDPSTAI